MERRGLRRPSVGVSSPTPSSGRGREGDGERGIGMERRGGRRNRWGWEGGGGRGGERRREGRRKVEGEEILITILAQLAIHTKL